ncbi:MAG: response regulator [Ekhidna sp.]|uniref:ATP-binding protein n=1 Tax=Ekhidna sp. TaxID=2608089 RepID=UPI0032EDCA9F
MASKSWNVVSWGVDETMPFDQSIRIRLVNIFALLAAASTLPYVFVFYGKELFLADVSVVSLICFLMTWLWNRLGWHYLAKLWMYFTAHAYLFTTASTFGRDAGEHLVLIPVLFGAVLVFEFREKLSLLFAILFTIGTIVALILTDFSLFEVPLTVGEVSEYYYGNLTVTFFCCVVIAICYFYLYGQKLEENEQIIAEGKEIEKTINYFSNSLFGKNSVDEILWDVAKNCIGQLGFVDCVIYLVDEEKKVLVQKAAYGHKNPQEFEIYQPIDIPIGKGIVGAVAESARPIIVPDTSKDPRYIADDAHRLSELAVPLVYNQQVIGVVDSEHPDKYFFTEHHLNILKTIASLCANKVIRAIAEQEREHALKMQLEAEKIKSFDELKTKLFANVSHELRTPLTLIIGTIDRQLESSDTSEWSLLKKHTDRLLRLINQLLDLSKLESGQFRLNESPGDIIRFFQTLVDLHASFAENKGVKISLMADKPSLWLAYDQDALEKIFYNLISNAIKFSRAEEEVTIRVSYDESLHVVISDCGIGIPKEELQRIFDRYYQSDTHRSPGTGIGLALTKELIDLHQGRIAVDSQVGAGTTFRVDLPLRKSPPTSESEPQAQVMLAEGQEQFILLVEDNEDISTLICETLSDYELVRAENGNEAMKMANEKVPDLIITDVMMPGMDGLAFSEWIRDNELTSHIPLIMLTARADKETKMAGLRAGADDFITKPFDGEELRTRVSNMLKRREQLREKYRQIARLPESEIVVTSQEDIFLKKLIHTIEEHLNNNEFGASDLSREMALSRMQLHRKITALTNHSTSSFIRHLRLAKAARKLSQGESVSQTAYAVGFSSLSYFTKAFKEEFGKVPSEFAAAAQVLQ